MWPRRWKSEYPVRHIHGLVSHMRTGSYDGVVRAHMHGMDESGNARAKATQCQDVPVLSQQMLHCIEVKYTYAKRDMYTVMWLMTVVCIQCMNTHVCHNEMYSSRRMIMTYISVQTTRTKKTGVTSKVEGTFIFTKPAIS